MIYKHKYKHYNIIIQVISNDMDHNYIANLNNYFIAYKIKGKKELHFIDRTEFDEKFEESN